MINYLHKALKPSDIVCFTDQSLHHAVQFARPLACHQDDVAWSNGRLQFGDDFIARECNPPRRNANN